MKKIFAIILVFVLALTTNSTNLSAAEKEHKTNDIINLHDEEVVIGMGVGDGTQGSIMPLGTWTGPGGTIRVDYMQSAKAISYSVNCTVPGARYFSGAVNVTNNKTGKTTSYYVYDTLAGGKCSRVVYIKVTKGQTYTVRLQGGCTNLQGKQVSYTLPNSIFVSP